MPTWEWGWRSGAHLLVSYLLNFHTVHGDLVVIKLECFAIPSSSGPHFVRTPHYDPFILGGPHSMFTVSLSYASHDKAEIYESESKVAQSYPTLCNSMDCSLPCSSIHGIFQARVPAMPCHFLLQRIFLTQDQTWVSYIAGRRFTV